MERRRRTKQIKHTKVLMTGRSGCEEREKRCWANRQERQARGRSTLRSQSGGMVSISKAKRQVHPSL